MSNFAESGGELAAVKQRLDYQAMSGYGTYEGANGAPEVVSATLMYPFGGELTEMSATDRYRFGGKELDTRGGLFHYDFDARWYDPVFPAFTSVDPMAEKYPHLSPYAYCAGNPVRYIDPSGEDPIYIEKDGEIILIGDNGKTDQIAYLVQGSVAESVQQSKDKYYSGDLTEGENVFTIPIGDVMVRMKDTVDRACEVERETGGHFMSGSDTPFIWDEGSGISEDGTSSSVKAFIVDGKHTNPSKAENIAWIWHAHHPSSVNGELGDSNPSEKDLTFHGNLIENGYKGNSILIGARVKEVAFYNNTGVLKKISLSNFYKMGEILK